MRVLPGGRVEVVVPRGTGPKAVHAFVSENRDWIARSVAEMSSGYEPPSIELPETIHLRAIEQKRRLILLDGKHNRLKDDPENGELLVEHAGSPRLMLRRWLSKIARQYLVPQMRTLSLATGLGYKRAQVRRQRSRWGSCSSTGTISINYCLLFIEPALSRYLMIHELCHTRHMNHSKRYWSLVSQYVPNWKEMDQKLGQAWKDVPAWVFQND